MLFFSRLFLASEYPVDSAVTALVEGIILGMASGEEPVSLVSDNVQVRIRVKIRVRIEVRIRVKIELDRV
jgi:hypothetical protein